MVRYQKKKDQVQNIQLYSNKHRTCEIITQHSACILQDTLAEFEERGWVRFLKLGRPKLVARSKINTLLSLLHIVLIVLLFEFVLIKVV